MSNYSILQQNTLAGLSEPAQFLYLKLLDVFQGHKASGERKAFLAACLFEDRCAGVLDYILRNMPGAPDDRTRSELARFHAERWRHNFMEVLP
jgi:hypothetical protein